MQKIEELKRQYSHMVSELENTWRLSGHSKEAPAD